MEMTNDEIRMTKETRYPKSESGRLPLGERFVIGALVFLSPFVVRHSSFAAGVDFNRDVRPILSQHCFKCHGPDQQKSGLRLDQRASAVKPAKSDAIAIVPGRPDASELLRRVSSRDPDERMPPPGGGNTPLTAAQIETLRAWIAAGAEYRAHWAYVKPVKSPVPDGVNPVDHFVRAKLAEAGLAPSPPASLETLCRRLHLDLIGLPPTPEEVAAFVKDPSDPSDPSNLSILVDRLLASPRFGEKWARHWLDLARYGDSAGYQHDDDMPLWLYRDWVIRALNADMPFDQFTIEQIAGDLLPNATPEQRIATGFHRAATVTLGADQNMDELRAQLVWDRVNTVGTTWLAASLECAQCHTHKFDPIPITDYYRLYAYFNRTAPELTKEAGSHYFITGGILELPDDPARTRRVEELKAAMNAEVARMLAVKVKLEGAGAAPLRRIFTGPPESRSPERVFYYLTEELKGPGPAEIRPHIAKLRELGRELLDTLPPRALVLEEAANPPVTRVFLRGNVRTPGEEVQPGVPGALHPPPPGAPANRLGLAQWLVSRDNPLTARVVVNRWWAELFGTGLVATPEDFGLQGEVPSHPELLDWLAVELMDNGWSLKRLLKLIVTSETYQQSSRITPELLARDPQNRLLTRGPRHRLDAELLRDNALAIGGLLQHELGGKPAFATPEDARAAQKRFTWRRGIYVRQQRGEPYATFASLDAPDRFACSAKRPRTNTPQQALALLNEPVFIAAAEALARRVERELPGAAFDVRLDRVFRLCTARAPKPHERDTLRELFDKTLRDGAAAPAAWTLLANVLLNLDETLSKE
jgi:hypothetical protein